MRGRKETRAESKEAKHDALCTFGAVLEHWTTGEG